MEEMGFCMRLIPFGVEDAVLLKQPHSMGLMTQWSTEEGQAQGRFEILFVFTDIFSFDPSVSQSKQRETVPLGGSPSGVAAQAGLCLSSLQKKNKASQSASWRRG